MRLGLSTRIFVGYLAILVVFAAATLFSVQRMHAIREDLRLIHRGYLAMTRLATQVRTLQEAKDAYVGRALSEQSPAVRRQLVAYAREFYPKALRDRLDEIDRLAVELEIAPLAADDRAFLARAREQIAEARDMNDAYDEATARLLESIEGRDAASEPAALVEAYRLRSEGFGRSVRALSIAMEAKIADAVLKAERDERGATFAVVAMAAFATLIGAAILVMMNRALRPLRQLVETAKAIGRGSLDVAVPKGGPDEVGELAREFDAMLRALRDREGVLAARTDELLRLSGFAENVIRSVRVGIVVLDREGRVRTLNPAARSVFHLPLVDVDGRSMRDLTASYPALTAALDRLDAVRTNGAPEPFALLKLGDKVVDVALVPMIDRAGTSMDDVLLLGEDVTTREETKDRLLQTERLAAIGRLAAQITHEIRNPLSSVALNVELLSDDVVHLPTERQGEARTILEAVGKEIDRLAQITEGYLRFARLPAPVKVEGDVGDLCADLVAFVQGEAQREGRMLELNVEAGLPKVPHDPARLRQALLNLLRNAAEAAGQGGTVRLSAKRGGKLGGVRLAVEDTGPGVPDDVKARLFEPFFTTKPSGTGLGLLLTAEIVKEHRGELSLETSPLGGAAFFIDLPPG